MFTLDVQIEPWKEVPLSPEPHSWRLVGSFLIWLLATALFDWEGKIFPAVCHAAGGHVFCSFSRSLSLVLSYLVLEVQCEFSEALPLSCSITNYPSEVHRQTNTLHLFLSLPEEGMGSFSCSVSLLLCMFCYQIEYLSAITNYPQFMSQSLSNLHVCMIFQLNNPTEIIFRSNFYSRCRYMTVWCHTLPL